MDQIDHLRIKRRGSSRNGEVQRWRSGESTRLPQMWPGFDSQIRRHMWVEFGGSVLCTERFSAGTLVSPLLKNQHFTCFIDCKIDWLKSISNAV